MRKPKADQFEYALQRAARGEPVEGSLPPLLHTARQVMILSEPPPPPPHGLLPGRGRFLAEAARLRTERWPSRQPLAGVTRLAAALAVVAVLFGAVLGAERAAAASLPGQPFYAVKLATETMRLALTRDPASRAALDGALAEERLDEILALLERKQPIGPAVSSRALRQLDLALAEAAQLQDPAAAQALGRLAVALRQREQAMLRAAGEQAEPPLLELLRTMERVRQRLRHRRSGTPQGTPAEPTTLPGPTGTLQPSRTPGPQPSGTAHTPSASRTPGPSHTPQGTGQPSASPGPSSTPAHTPGSGATLQPTAGPHASRTPGPGATMQPTTGPQASRTPGPGATMQPTAGPQASRTPAPGGASIPIGGPGGTPGPGQTPGSGGGGNKP